MFELSIHFFSYFICPLKLLVYFITYHLVVQTRSFSLLVLYSTFIHIETIMAPSAITPPRDVQQTSELTAAAVALKIAKTAPALLNQPK